MDDAVDPELRERIESDPLCALLGIEFRTIREGYAETALTVTDDHCNFNGSLHGGVIFALADAAGSAVAYADGATRVGLESNVSYLAPAEPGETVVARAEVTHASRRFQETRVVVEKADGTRVATVRGRGYAVD